MSDKLIGAVAAAKRFKGSRATGYDARRSVRPHWIKEHAAVESMLVDLPKGSSVLDIPVGTGRYASIYKQFGLTATGMDVSDDMLDVAKATIDRLKYRMDLTYGNALNLFMGAASVDAVVCTRLVNWFLPDEMTLAITELMRVVRDRLVISIELGARLSESGNRPHESAVFGEALKEAGAIEQRRIEISPGYWMIQLGHAA